MTELSPFIPVIDMAPLLGGDQRGVAGVSEAVRQAFTTSGFCYVRNHGVPADVIAQAARTSLDFFHLPLEEKLEAAPKEAVRGFNAIGRTKMRGAMNPDYKEYFQIGLELPRDDPAVLAGQPLRGPNQWPRGLPQFETAFTRYFEAIGACGQRFLRAVAFSLGAPETFFVDKYDKPLQRTIRRTRSDGRTSCSASRPTPTTAASPCCGRTTWAAWRCRIARGPGSRRRRSPTPW